MKAPTRFAVQVGRDGRVVAVEDGDRGDVPEELLPVVAGLVRQEVPHSAFLWSGPGAAVLCRVTVDLEGAGATAMVAGEYCYDVPFGLTAREIDVLALLAIGIPNAEIAARLELSTRTVTTHVDHVMRKMGVYSRTSAAVVAVDNGLIKVPFPGGDDGFAILRLGQALRQDGVRRVRGTRRVVKKALVLGAALPLRGFAAADGAEMLQASQLAMREVNDRGGIDGRLLSMEVVDVDIFDADSIRRGMAALAARDVDLLTSGYFAHQEVAHDIVAEWGIPYLHAATMHAMEQRVRAAPGRYGRIFQVCASDANYAPRFVEVMSELRDRGQWVPSSRRLVVIQSAWDLSDLGVARAALLAERAGWSLELISLDTGSAESWSAVADRVRRSEPAAVMLGHYLVDGTVDFIRSFLASPPDTLVYSIYAPSIPEFRDRLGEAAEGIVWATVTGTYSDPLARSFVAKYRARYGRSPGRSHAGIAYDRVRLAAQAWAQAANPRDPRSVAAELRSVIHRGVNGVYYFGDDSQTARTYPTGEADPSLAQAHLVFQVQDGSQRIISPAPYADAVFRPQPWLVRSRQQRAS